jgi:hypothetical protein
MLIYNFRRDSYLSNNYFDGLAFSEVGNESLALFLYELNLLPHCEPEIGQNIMSIYLEGIRPATIQCYKKKHKEKLKCFFRPDR